MRLCPGRFTNPVSRKGHVSTQNVPRSFKLLSALLSVQHIKKNTAWYLSCLSIPVQNGHFSHALATEADWGERIKVGGCDGKGKKPAGMGTTKRGAAQLPAQEMMMYETCTTQRAPWSHVGTGASSSIWRCCALRAAALFLGLTQHGSSSQPVACGCGEELSHHGICWLRNPTETK